MREQIGQSSGGIIGYFPIQLEGLNISLNEWSDLLYSDKVIAQELLFPSGNVKETIFSESGS